MIDVDLRGTDGRLLWMDSFKPDPLPRSWRILQDGLDGCAYGHANGLMVILSGNRESDGRRWLHVSCSHRRHLPSWEEMRMAKDLFIGPDRYAAQIFPPSARHVNLHPYCLHLFACVDGDWPLPEMSTVIAGVRTI